jgi:kynurenine formamidase
MCDVCLMNKVKETMLSRRSFFRAAAAAGAAVAAAGTTLAPRPAVAQPHGTVLDMTHLLTEDFPTFFGQQWAHRTQVFSFDEHGLYGNEWRLNEHVGTHMDAPIHFGRDGLTVDELPVQNFVASLCVVDIRARAAEDPDTTLTPDDLSAWIATHGPIPDGACVAMLSGWDAHVRTPKFRNADEAGVMHFPGFHGESAAMLLETGAASIAVDTLSLDPGPSADIPVHLSWLPANRFGVECMANLAAVPASGATVIIAPPKLERGSGGTTRVFTLV